MDTANESPLSGLKGWGWGTGAQSERKSNDWGWGHKQYLSNTVMCKRGSC